MRLTRVTRAALAATIALTLGGPAAPARAAEFTVTRTDDTVTCTPGDCSLRGAIVAANKAPGPDVIQLPAGTYVLSVASSDSKDDPAQALADAETGDLDVVKDSNVTIVGDGPDRTIVDGNGVSTGDRVFDVHPGAILQVGGATLRNGLAAGGTIIQGGGGIRNRGSLILQNVVLRDHRVIQEDAGGGGIENEGGASATLTNVTIRDNEVLNGHGGGGGIVNAGFLTVQNSTLANNRAPIGGGIYNSGANAAAGLTNVTISDNRAIVNTIEAASGGGRRHRQQRRGHPGAEPRDTGRQQRVAVGRQPRGVLDGQAGDGSEHGLR